MSAAPCAGDAHANRVAVVHRQARPTLVIALAFALAAGAVALAPGDTGRWLPLHLLLVGALLSAISGATQLLAVTWSSAPAPGDRPVRVQRALIVAGAIGLALARQLDGPKVVIGVAGAGVVGGLVLLARLLATIRARAVLDRFHPALTGYLLAITLGVAGSVGGLLLATDAATSRYAAVRSAHLTVNLLGLVGLVIASTLPFFVATQIRSKMAPAATARSLRLVVGLLAAAVVVAGAGQLAERPSVAAGGFGGYLVGLVAVVALCPRPDRRQLRWAGPRLAMLAAGTAWWAGCVVALGVASAQDRAMPASALGALAVGGYAQILAASLAYLGPVLRGGGHERLAAGFLLTRSWWSLAAANASAIGIVAGAPPLVTAAVVTWVGDASMRAVRLIAGSHRLSAANG